MHHAIELSGPGSAIRIQGLHNLLHENGRTSGKLVARMNDRVSVNAKVEHRGYIIGWDDGSSPEPLLINHSRNNAETPESELGYVGASKEKNLADA